MPPGNEKPIDSPRKKLWKRLIVGALLGAAGAIVVCALNTKQETPQPQSPPAVLNSK